MIERVTDGLLQGELIRYPALPREPRREPAPEVLEIVRRARQKLLREYLERRRAAGGEV